MKNIYKQRNKAITVNPLTGIHNFVSRMLKRPAVWPLILTLCLVLGAGNVWGQTTLFSDNFGTSGGTSYSAAAGAIGSNANWFMSRSGADWGARIHGDILDLTNDASTTGNVNGWIFGYRDINTLSGWNTTLSSNTGTITWEFNIRVNRSNLSGFTAGSYGLAFILAGTSITANNSGSGYALVLGNSSTPDPFRLVSYNNGLQGTQTAIITSNTTGFTDIGQNYYSVRITYNPSNNNWELFLRDDGTTAFADPTGGAALASQGIAVNNSYTSTTGMRYIGGYWQGSTGTNQTAFFDNVYLKVTPATTTPAAPTITSITPGNQQLSVAFTAGSDGGSAITTYKYSTDGGTSWQTRASGTTASPLVISTLSTDGTTTLTNGTSYSIQIRAVNAVGDGTATASTAATPRTTPGAPTITGITPGNQQLSVAFTAGSDGGSAITTYQYSTDGGTSWRTRTSGTTASPLVISTLSTDGSTVLTNGVSYDIQIRAVNAAGDGTPSSTTSATPVAPSSPTLNPITLASALSSTYGTASAGVSFSVGGANLTTTITATPQSGYEIATSFGGPYLSTAISGVTDGATLWVRFASTLSAGNYDSQTAVVLSGGGASSDANITTSATGNTIAQKGLTVSGLAAQNKEYDGQTTATATGTPLLNGVVGTDDVTLSGTPAFTFTTAGVGTAKTVNTTGYTLTGTAIANYTLMQPELLADITAKALTITANNVSKVQGVALSGGAGSTAFTSNGLVGIETIGSVTITYGTAGAATGDGNTVGVYPGQVVPSAATGGTFTSSNYDITYVAGSITVTPAPIAAWNFATTSPTSSNSNLSVSAVAQGNNNGTTSLLSSSSASSGYTGASGGNNASAAARTGVLNTATNGSAYFEFTITPNSGFEVTINEVSFGSRGTSTGPQAVSLRSSADDYTSDIFTATLVNNSTWALVANSSLNVTIGLTQSRTFRLYGYNGTGTASASTANWRIDDLRIMGSIVENTNPTIEISVASLSGFTQNSVLPSTEQNYTVSGDNLTTDVTITPPTGYEISTSTGGSFSATNPITLSVSGGNIVGEPVTIYVRQNAGALGAVSGNITHSSAGANNPIVAVSGTRTGTYYSKPTGNLDELATWGLQTDGSGATPTNFSTDGVIYEIRNRATATIGANWTVTGAASRVVVGDGSNATDFIIPAAHTLTGTVDISNAAELTIENLTAPTLGTLATNSTLEYNGVPVTLSTSITYRNLKLKGTGDKTFPGGTTIVAGNLVLENTVLKDGTTSFSTIRLGGDLTYVGTVTAPADDRSITLSTNGTAGGTQTITGAGNTVRWFRISTTTANTILLSTTGGSSNLNLGNISGGGITLVDGSVLNMNGNDMTLFNSNSTSNAFVLNTSGTISTNSSTDFTIQRTGNGNLGTLRFASGANTIGNLTFNHTGTTNNSLTIGNALNVTGTITVTDGTLVSNGNITLQSTPTGTASVATIGTGGSITGDVTVERYFGTNKRAWRLVTAPVAGSSNNSIFANWQNNGTVTPGTGVEIWGPGGDVATNGLAVGPLASMRGWDNDNGVFSDVTDSRNRALFNAANANPLGYFLFVTGPFGSGNIAGGFAPATVRATGALRQGNQTFSIAAPVADRYYMVSNPYASPVNQGNGGTVETPSYAVAMSNTTNHMWMWDPNLNDVFGSGGGYVSFDRLNNTYSVSTASSIGLSYADGNNYTRLQSGQAFFVRAATNPSGALTVAFTESSKGGSDNNSAFRSSNPSISEKMRLTLQRNNSGTFVTTDGAVAFFYNNANAAVDDMDGAKLSNPADNLMFRRAGTDLTFEHYPLAAPNDILFLNLSATTTASYRLVVEGSDFPVGLNLSAWLLDSYLNTETQLSLSGIVNYDFEVDGNAASTGQRFRIEFRTIGSPLSVQFKALRATRGSNGIAVEWNTENEQELVDYSVERSADGRGFSSIGRVAARNNQQPELYRWNDAQPGSGDNFYRIKAQTRQGRSFYSSIVRVRAANSGKGISVYPNPVAKGQPLNVELRGMQKGTYRVTVFSPMGVQVLHRVLEHVGGDAAQTLLLPAELPAGTYVVDITDASGSRMQYKLTLQ